MGRDPENDREGQLAWIAAQVRVPADRIAASAAWRSYPGPGDSLDLIELLFVLERELDISQGGRP
jgi:acyl carrier protein